MSTDIGGQVADRQRAREAKRTRSPKGAGTVAPPRQRRPALAALALLLIVGGALGAGLLAVRLDDRVPVLAAKTDIVPGQLITEDSLKVVQVAGDGLELIPEELAAQVVDGATYAEVHIEANSLVDQNMLTKDSPIGAGRAIVSVPLNPASTPASELQGGDLVRVMLVSGGEAAGRSKEITDALVLSVNRATANELASTQQATTASLLVPDDVATEVVDAAAADRAGLALLAHGMSPADLDSGGQR